MSQAPMSDTETELFERFKRWAYTPDTTPAQDLGPKDRPTAQEALEAGMWAAYRAGYSQAVSDCDGVQRLAGFLNAGKK